MDGGEHGHRPGRHDGGQDLTLDRRRPHVSARPRREHAERRLARTSCCRTSSTTKARVKVEAIGNVFFDVSAVDFQVRDAAEQLALLVEFTTGLGTGKSLTQLAAAAQRQLAKGNVDDACDTLQSFLNQVKAQTGKSLTPAQAAELTLRATTIRTALGC